jgi:hypothetical protein
MKKFALVLLGLFLAGMALTAVFHGGGILGIAFGIAFTAGAWRSFRAVRRLTPPASTKPRPWER